MVQFRSDDYSELSSLEKQRQFWKLRRQPEQPPPPDRQARPRPFPELLFSRIQRGMTLDYCKCKRRELRAFCVQRGLQRPPWKITKSNFAKRLFDADEDATFHGFLELPPEIRLCIYKWYAAGTRFLDHKCLPAVPPIAQVCRVVRQESLSISRWRAILLYRPMAWSAGLPLELSTHFEDFLTLASPEFLAHISYVMIGFSFNHKANFECGYVIPFTLVLSSNPVKRRRRQVEHCETVVRVGNRLLATLRATDRERQRITVKEYLSKVSDVIGSESYALRACATDDGRYLRRELRPAGFVSREDRENVGA